MRILGDDTPTIVRSSVFVYPMLCWSELISSGGLTKNNSSSVVVNPEFLPGYGVPPVPPTPPRPLSFFILLLSCTLHVAPLNSVQYRPRTNCIRDTVQCRYPRRNSMRIGFHGASCYLVSQCRFRIASRYAGWRWLLWDFWLGDRRGWGGMREHCVWFVIEAAGGPGGSNCDGIVRGGWKGTGERSKEPQGGRRRGLSDKQWGFLFLSFTSYWIISVNGFMPLCPVLIFLWLMVELNVRNISPIFKNFQNIILKSLCQCQTLRTSSVENANDRHLMLSQCWHIRTSGI